MYVSPMSPRTVKLFYSEFIVSVAMLAYFVLYLPYRCRQMYIQAGLEPQCQPAALSYLPIVFFMIVAVVSGFYLWQHWKMGKGPEG